METEEENIQEEGLPVEKKGDLRANKAYKFIIGFVIAVALLIFVISTVVLVIKVIPDISTLVAGVFQSTDKNTTDSSSNDPLLSVTDSFLATGDMVTFSWKENESLGKYSLTFLCEDEDEISIEHRDDFTDCGDALLFNQGETEADITFTSNKKRYVDIPSILEFEDQDGNIDTIDEIQITVSNKNPNDGSILGIDTDNGDTSINVTSTDDTPAKTSPAPVRDLSVQILQVGEVVNEQIIGSSSFDTNAVIGMRFEIRNNGNVSTGSWLFQIILPVVKTSDRLFNSGIQGSLSPGESTIYTITFSGIRGGNNLALISVDPQNLIRESSENNNQAQASFNSTGNGFTGSNTGEADFDIDLIAIGRISGSRFIETNNIDVDDELAIKFRVTNIGGETTENWRFDVEVDEPRNADDLDYRSKRYDKLDPGEYREVILRYDNLDEDGNYDFDIEVDQEKDTDEDKRSNNKIRFDVDIDN